MNLSDELHRQIQSYVASAIEADTLFGWLASVAHEAPDSSDATAREAWGTAFLLLSELSSGDLSEDEVRQQLTELIGRQETGAAMLATVTVAPWSRAPRLH